MIKLIRPPAPLPSSCCRMGLPVSETHCCPISVCYPIMDASKLTSFFLDDWRGNRWSLEEDLLHASAGRNDPVTSQAGNDAPGQRRCRPGGCRAGSQSASYQYPQAAAGPTVPLGTHRSQGGGGAAPLLWRGGCSARSCIHTRGAWLAGRSETPPQHAPSACAGQG